MKKKVLIIILIVAVVLVALFAFAYIRVMNPFNVGIDPLTRQNEQAETETGKRLEISFSYSKQRLVASSQYAFWIEDMDGNYIDTIYVTQWTAQGGFSYRPLSIPQWVSVANPANMSSTEIDAISGATPFSGDYKITWDFTDRNGNPVTGTQLRYFIEGTMNNNDDVIFSGIIELGSEKWEETPTPIFSFPDSEYKNMLTNVSVAFFPG